MGPAAAAPGTVALVFGREESGLLENELLLCSHACAIPTGARVGCIASAYSGVAWDEVCAACALHAGAAVGLLWHMQGMAVQLLPLLLSIWHPLLSLAGRTQPSLNLSHAVAVIASQLFDLQQQRLMAECLGDEEQQRVEQQQQAEQQQGQQQAAQPAAEQGQQQQQAANATLLSGSLLTGSLFESGEAAGGPGVSAASSS